MERAPHAVQEHARVEPSRKNRARAAETRGRMFTLRTTPLSGICSPACVANRRNRLAACALLYSLGMKRSETAIATPCGADWTNTRITRMRMILGCVLALGTLRCGGAGAETSSVPGCQQQLNGGSSIPKCTCAAMTASPPSSNSHSTVELVASTTSDKIAPDYDLGLPAGTQVCFVAMAGQVTVSSPAGVSATTYPYSFAIFTESPWTLTESGATPTQPTPGTR
jgi:hypothetical protein